MEIIGFSDVPGSVEKFWKWDSIKNKENVVIVCLEIKNKEHALSDYFGLDIVLEKAQDAAKIVVMAAISSEVMLARDARWHAALGQPNTIFLRLPFTGDDLEKAIENSLLSPRSADPLAIRLLTVKNQNSEASRLLHQIENRYKTLSISEQKSWLYRVEEALGERGEFEDVFKKLEKLRNFSSLPLKGLSFKDVCVDVDGTLFVNNEINKEVLALVEKKSAAESIPITIWTGGDVRDLEDKIRKKGILWKIVSKEVLNGAKVNIVIDDLPEEEFKKKYKISFNEYIKI